MLVNYEPFVANPAKNVTHARDHIHARAILPSKKSSFDVVGRRQPSR